MQSTTHTFNNFFEYQSALDTLESKGLSKCIISTDRASFSIEINLTPIFTKHNMNLIRFTFANIFDFKSVMDSIKRDIHKDINLYEPSCFHSCNSDTLIILFSYFQSPLLALNYVNSICTPTDFKELHE